MVTTYFKKHIKLYHVDSDICLSILKNGHKVPSRALEIYKNHFWQVGEWWIYRKHL
jgi:hypothetical protein